MKNPEVGLLDIIVGNNITVDEDGTIRLYGNTCRIKGKFSPTGSTLDNAVYMNYDTVKQLIRSSFDKGLNQYEIFDTETVISSVLVKVKQGYNAEDVAERIRQSVSGVSVATSKSMVSGIASSLSEISKTVNIFVAVFWVLSLGMTLLIFLMMIHERKREFASLKAMGAGGRIVSRLVAKEAACVNLAGGVLSVLFCALVFVSFHRAFADALGAGFVLPSVDTLILLALCSILAVMLSALVSAFFAIKSIGKMDASLILKEGE